MKYSVFKTAEYEDWLTGESLKSQVQIEKRIEH